MATERDALRTLVEGVELRGDADRARRRGHQLRRRRRLVASGAVCAVLLLGGGLVAALADGNTRNSQIEVVDRPSTTTTPAVSSTTVDSATVGDVDGFGELPAPPITIDRGTAVVRVGDSVVAWGSVGGRDGARFDYRGTSTWQPVSPAPDELGVGPASAMWTGTHAIVMTGDPVDGEARAAMYDPAADSWRMIADPPFRRGEQMTMGWTQNEAIFYGVGAGDCVAEHQGYAYDPGSDEWRQLADPPFGVRAGTASVWTGNRLVVIGGSRQQCSNEPRDPRRDGAVYTPATDSWLPVAPHPEADPSWAVALGSEVVVFDQRCSQTCSATSRYDPFTREWTDLGTHGPAVHARLHAHLSGQLIVWAANGEGHVLTDNGWRAGPPLPAELVADPLSLHLVGETVPMFALGPGRLLSFPSPAGLERIERSLQASTIADQLNIHARHPQMVPIEQVPLADEVTFAFGPTVLGTRSADELADPEAWVFAFPPGPFEGSFSVLDVLRDAGPMWVRGGPHDRCTEPPLQPPPGAEDAFQTGYVGDGTRSCNEWWAVDVFVQDDRITFIRYDLIEP